ncbi:MAG: branched-chain amino acid ABC transporter permease [Propylenella sp.]
MFEVVLNGLVLGGMYGLIALGLNLQYGIARMLNLSYGEFFTAGAFASFFAFTLYKLNPLLGLAVSVPIAFAANWLIYRFLLLPLIRRAPNRDALDGDVVLCTFGLLFVFQGFEQIYWGGNVRAYQFLAFPIHLPGAMLPANRLMAFIAAMALGGILILALRKTRFGTALRAIAIDPIAASLSGINVLNLSALAFALGGAMVAISGALVSTFIAISASIGILFTLKALIVIIVGGPGRMGGAIAAGLLLGLAEALGGYLIDSSHTLAFNYAILILVLLIKPTGLFARG